MLANRQSIDLIVRGRWVLTMDEAGPEIIKDGAIAVHDGLIVELGPDADILARYSAHEVVGGPERAIMPGMTNSHTHSPMSLLRGIADDLPLIEWLERHIWPAENAWLSEEFVRDATEVACLEMLTSGVTSCSDMYFFQDATAEVMKRFGMRAVLGAGVIDFPTKTTTGPDDCISRATEFIARWKGERLITPSIAVHSAYTCGPDTLKKSMAMAGREGVLCQIHLSETEWEVGEIQSRYGNRPAHHLDSLGVLNDRLLAAHCVWLDEDEIALMAKRGVKVAHCIESNLKLASGVAPIPKILRAGITVGLGTDGAASNNDLCVLGEAQTVSKVHKAVWKDPTVMDAYTVLGMATRGGAKAIGLPRCGYIAKGAMADIVTIDLMRPHMVPMYNLPSQIVYSMKSSDVRDVIVDGKMVVRDGHLVNADADEIMHKAVSWGERIKKG